MFDHPSFDGHEGVHAFHDAATGLRCVIAVHSTALGPAAGGCRMWNYPTSEAMLTDVLRLSQGMSYKNAMAGIPLGGGKAVIWGDPKSDKSPALFRAFGRAVQSLEGKYFTAEDVGVDVADMAVVREETRFVAGLDEGAAASGDPSPVTAKGVYLGIREVARRLFGTDDLNGRTIAVQGVGSVGGYTCDHLAEAGANLIITDIDQAALADVGQAPGSLRRMTSTMSRRTSFRRMRSARSSTKRPWRASRSRAWPAARITSWSCRRWASSCAARVSSTPPITSSMAAVSSTWPPRFPAATRAPGSRRHWRA
jgi:glutamate dehydrogenase/leucine dehydrogenase